MPFHQMLTDIVLPHIRTYYTRDNYSADPKSVKSTLIINLGHQQTLKGKEANSIDSKEDSLDYRQLSNNKTLKEHLESDNPAFKSELATLVKIHTDWKRLSKLFIILRLEHRLENNMKRVGICLDIISDFLTDKKVETDKWVSALCQCASISTADLHSDEKIDVFAKHGVQEGQLIQAFLKSFTAVALAQITRRTKAQSQNSPGQERAYTDLDSYLRSLPEQNSQKVEETKLGKKNKNSTKEKSKKSVEDTNEGSGSKNSEVAEPEVSKPEVFIEFDEQIRMLAKLSQICEFKQSLLATNAIPYSCMDAWLEDRCIEDLKKAKELMPELNGDGAAFQGRFNETIEAAITVIASYREYCKIHDQPLPAGKSKNSSDLESLRHYFNLTPGDKRALQDRKFSESLTPFDVIIKNLMFYYSLNAMEDANFHVTTASAWKQSIRNIQSAFGTYNPAVAKKKREIIKDFIYNLHETYPASEPHLDQGPDPWRPIDTLLASYKNVINGNTSALNILFNTIGIGGWYPDINLAYIKIVEELNQWTSFELRFGGELIKKEKLLAPKV